MTKRNIETVDQGRFSDNFGISFCLSLLGWNVLHEQCTPCKAKKFAFLREHSRCLMTTDYVQSLKKLKVSRKA